MQAKLSTLLLTCQSKNNYHNTSSAIFTATILEWKHLLKPAKYKDVIKESLGYMVKERRIEVNAFTIMTNHIHLANSGWA